MFIQLFEHHKEIINNFFANFIFQAISTILFYFLMNDNKTHSLFYSVTIRFQRSLNLNKSINCMNSDVHQSILEKKKIKVV